jgi:hypothetical protein
MGPETVGPCVVSLSPVHVLLMVLQSITAVLVAWLTSRAKRKDREERERNGHDTNGH